MLPGSSSASVSCVQLSNARAARDCRAVIMHDHLPFGPTRTLQNYDYFSRLCSTLRPEIYRQHRLQGKFSNFDSACYQSRRPYRERERAWGKGEGTVPFSPMGGCLKGEGLCPSFMGRLRGGSPLFHKPGQR